MLLFVGAVALYVLVAVPFDASGGLPQQWLVSALTWLFVVLSLLRAHPAERTQVIAMIGVATLYECLGSLTLKLYEYRFANLPMYVPPGHGLFYLVALRLASLPFLRQHTFGVVVGVAIASGLWALRGVLLSPVPDTLGLLCWFLLVPFLVRGRDPLFFALSFLATMSLEYYGTFLGTWRWAEVVPILGISAANPPSSIGAGYCVIDMTTQLSLMALYRLRRLLGHRWGGEKHVAP